jgi:hypothetical protein
MACGEAMTKNFCSKSSCHYNDVHIHGAAAEVENKQKFEQCPLNLVWNDQS